MYFEKLPSFEQDHQKNPNQLILFPLVYSRIYTNIQETLCTLNSTKGKENIKNRELKRFYYDIMNAETLHAAIESFH